MTLSERLLAAVAAEPGRQALSVQADVRRDAMASRAAVSRETALLVAHGDLVLDGDHRLWPRDDA